MAQLDLARPVIERIYQAALDAADPRRAVRDAISLDGGELVIADNRVERASNVVVVAIGKAAVTMAAGALDALGDRIRLGIAITKDDHSEGVELPGFEIYEASHPIPDGRGVGATRRAIEIVESCGENDLILALISGGGSALFESPQPPVTLEDMQAVTGALLRAGAAIDELNAVRTPLSQVKGGGLLDHLGAASLITMIVSDVLGNDPRVIASGPTVPGDRDRRRARSVLERFQLWDTVPNSVRALLGESANSKGEPATEFPLAVIADNRSAVAAAEAAAVAGGLRTSTIWFDRTGEAREQAALWVAACQEAPPEIDCLIGGGELTVTVRGEGIGGRNTEFALAAALTLTSDEWIVASLATDGQDGPTGVAGGFLNRPAIEELRAQGIDLDASLDANDSLNPLRLAGGVVAPGPTGTNVNDLFLAIRTSALSHQ